MVVGKPSHPFFIIDPSKTPRISYNSEGHLSQNITTKIVANRREGDLQGSVDSASYSLHM
jgi:hypothetical protein